MPDRTPTGGIQAPRTLWEEGMHPGHLVVRAAIFVVLLTVGVDLVLGNDLGVIFDVVFVLICVASALWVRPSDFFTVGVLPPLLLAAVALVLSLVDRTSVANRDDPLVQAVVSGLAHHAWALVLGYALTLGLLALRQVALRHHGALRPGAAPQRRSDAEERGAQLPPVASAP